jgi:hypothetical protein
MIFGERRRMRALFLLSLIFASALGLYQADHAHAGEPTRCGFWSSIEAGLSCR